MTAIVQLLFDARLVATTGTCKPATSREPIGRRPVFLARSLVTCLPCLLFTSTTHDALILFDPG